MINYNNRKFKVKSTPNTGEVSVDLIFHYQQINNIVTCKYSDENVVSGHLIGKVDEAGNIDIRYHQINTEGRIKTGQCFSKPVLLDNGKIQLHETWEWLSGDNGGGNTVIEEI